MKYLVTGGAGFIGSNLVKRLLELGHQVSVFDNFLTGKWDNIKSENVTLWENDLRYYGDVREACKGMDGVFHLGALPSVSRSVKDPRTTNDINITGTLNVLRAMKRNGGGRVVFASSSSVYGDSEVLPKVETMREQPLSPYALSKLAGEKYCRIYSSILGVETIALRFFNVFGYNQDPTSEYSAVIPKFITAMLAGHSPVVYGDGEQSRDFTFVDDVVRGCIIAMNAPAEAVGGAYNIAGGERITINELIKKLNIILGTEYEPDYGDARKGDVKHSLADMSLIKQYIWYEPEIPFEEGLKRTVNWYKEGLTKEK